jgi:predicted ArsR family transcriptional regulator
VLSALLDELAPLLPANRRAALMEAVGRRLAAGAGARPTGDLSARVGAGAALLTSLGGGAEVEREEGRLVIRGCAGCPLSAATSHRPELCEAVRTLLSEFIGAPVRECCDRGSQPPRCHFEVPTAA